MVMSMVILVVVVMIVIMHRIVALHGAVGLKGAMTLHGADRPAAGRSGWNGNVEHKNCYSITGAASQAPGAANRGLTRRSVPP